ncbi:MAG: RNA polymerase sigma factor [Dethiobacteria bacterium]|jgi:RNA polymerase sigma-70 factor (ECF subfamily)
MAVNDNNLIRAIKHGDHHAMEQLIRNWYPRIYAYVLRMVGKEADAHDVTQETFLAMIKAIESFVPWGKFQNWIFKISHNKCMDIFRMHKIKNANMEQLHEENLYKKVHNEIDIEAKITDTVTIENALQRLPIMQREAIVLYYFNGFNSREIAQMTNTPTTTIKSRLSAAKKSLADYLKEGSV